MEYVITDTLAYVTVTVVFASVIYWFGVRRFSLVKDVPIPGPRLWPYLGNVPQILKHGGLHKLFMAYSRRYGRIFKMAIGRTPVIVVSDPETAKQIMVKHFSKFPNRSLPIRPNPPLDVGMFVGRDAQWKRVRTTLTPVFTAGKLKQMIPTMEEACDILLQGEMTEAANEGLSTDVVNIFSGFALDVILRAAFGVSPDVKSDRYHILLGRAKKAFQIPLWIRAFSMFPFSTFLSKHVNIISHFDYFVAVAKLIVAERRKQGSSGRKDLVQLMIEAHEDSVKLSDDEIAAQSLTFLLAGFESTANTLASTAYFLAMNPEVQRKLIQEIEYARKSADQNVSTYEFLSSMKYLDQVLAEVLRLCPPNFNILRECKETCVIHGIKFPAGVEVNIPVYVMQRDPEAYCNPDVFNPEHFSAKAKSTRHPFYYIPFGMGPRQCIGLRFALMEMKLCLVRVLECFRFEKTEETVARLEHRAMITMAPKDCIHLKIVHNLQGTAYPDHPQGD